MDLEAGQCYARRKSARHVLRPRMWHDVFFNCIETDQFHFKQGGGLQYSAAPNNDFSDWVGQVSQIWIAEWLQHR